jgi:hypothetical protein
MLAINQDSKVMEYFPELQAKSSTLKNWRRLASLDIVLSKLGGKYEIQPHLIWVYYTVRGQKSAPKINLNN